MTTKTTKTTKTYGELRPGDDLLADTPANRAPRPRLIVTATEPHETIADCVMITFKIAEKYHPLAASLGLDPTVTRRLDFPASAEIY